jgi:hypothetical protein
VSETQKKYVKCVDKGPYRLTVGNTYEVLDEGHLCVTVQDDDGLVVQPYATRFIDVVAPSSDAPTGLEHLAGEIGRLVQEKSDAYGDSVGSSSEAFRLLFPEGIPTDRYGDALLLVRVWDKMKRIATRKDAFGEDPWKDIAGYALRGAAGSK